MRDTSITRRTTGPSAVQSSIRTRPALPNMLPGRSAAGAAGACLLLLATARLASALPYHMGANVHWMPSAAASGDKGSVDRVMDGAQRLGLRVLRTWAFDSGLPGSPGSYDEGQARGLDYTVAAAGKRGMQVVLSLSNFWAAYRGPEVWLAWAEGSAAGKTVADYYKSPKVAQLLSDHIRAMTGRVNSITGVAYKDDPTILGWDVMNEPRCPGCNGAALAARDALLSTLVGVLKAAAPNQLAFSGTEGFFAPGSQHVGLNPGAGAQCEGEDWPAEVGKFDVASVHVYFRQMEALAATGWSKPHFEWYANYLHQKLMLYSDLAGAAGKPLVAEEFGLTRRFFGDEEVKVVYAIVGDALIDAKRRGRALHGAYFWYADAGGSDVGGYKIDVTRPPSGATIGLGGGIGSSSRSSNGSSSSSNGSSSSSSSSSPAPSPSPSGGFVSGRKLLLQQPPAGRGLHQVVVTPGDDELDGFRRGPARAACAGAAAGSWHAAAGPNGGGGVDVAAYRAAVAGVDVVDVIAETARLLNA